MADKPIREQSALELLETHAEALRERYIQLRQEYDARGVLVLAQKAHLERLRAALVRIEDTNMERSQWGECQKIAREALRGALETAAEPPPTPQWLAVQFHETYERLAPKFGYETRTGTRQFDPESPNGRLMMAVCAELLAREPALSRAAVETTPSPFCAICDHTEEMHRLMGAPHEFTAKQVKATGEQP